MMNPIDFDAQFTKYAEKWMRTQLQKGRKPEELEDEMPELYMRFINQEADWLDGMRPAMYFARWERPEELLALMAEYEKNAVSMPDLLLERIVDIGAPSVRPLMDLAADEQAPHSLRVTALNLLIELDAKEPLSLCVRLIAESPAGNELAEAAADLLRNMGSTAVDDLLQAAETASDETIDTFLDLLCNFPGLERVYEIAVSRFLNDPDHRALHASYLAKLGDPRAIEPLTKGSALSDLNYLDYIEIRDAIEELGGQAPAEREFAGDPYYESMKRLDG